MRALCKISAARYYGDLKSRLVPTFWRLACGASWADIHGSICGDPENKPLFPKPGDGVTLLAMVQLALPASLTLSELSPVIIIVKSQLVHGVRNFLRQKKRWTNQKFNWLDRPRGDLLRSRLQSDSPSADKRRWIIVIVPQKIAMSQQNSVELGRMVLAKPKHFDFCKASARIF